jgi:DNA-binding MarR family transcriptional regulator
LSYLSDPPHAESGATLTEIERKAEPEHSVQMGRLLAAMAGDGLIERKLDDSDARAKPYFITAKGEEYLESATAMAIFPQSTERQDWATRVTDASLPRMLAEEIRGLPEFEASDEGRLEEVSQQLAISILKLVDRK